MEALFITRGMDDAEHDAAAAIRRRVRAFGRHVSRLSRLPAGSSSHPVYLRAVGQYWQMNREEAGLSVDSVANELQMPPDELSLFEAGLIDLADRRDDFVEQLARAIGLADSLEIYNSLFGKKKRRRAPKALRTRRQLEE